MALPCELRMVHSGIFDGFYAAKQFLCMNFRHCLNGILIYDGNLIDFALHQVGGG